jgi:hypothetical protein
MGKNEERGAFKQAALKMAKYRLRRVMHEAGCTPQEVREAEVEGEDKMVEIILTKYDEGAIDLPGLEKSAGKAPTGSTSKKEEPKEEPKRNAKKDPPKKEKPPKDDDDDDDPYSSAFDDDDEVKEESKANDEDSGDDEDGPHGDDESVENHEADPPRKAERKAKRTEESTPDVSALEAKVDKLLDLTVSTIEAVVELRDVVDRFVERHTVFAEIVKFAFARIWKLGAAQPLKPGFGDVIAKAEEIANKALGKTPKED